MSERVSNYRLEKLVLGELPPKEEAELLGDPEVAGRVEAMRTENEEFLSHHPLRFPSPVPARRTLPEILGDLFSTGPRMVPILAAFAVAAVASSFFFLGGPSVDDGTRLKGEPASLYLYRKTSTEAVELQDGATARRGDTIQAAYTVADRAYGFIFSLDGNGRLTSHLPESGRTAAELTRGELRVLSSSYILDDAPNYELFLLVTSRRPFTLDQVERVALELPVNSQFVPTLEKRLGSDFSVVSMRLSKE